MVVKSIGGDLKTFCNEDLLSPLQIEVVLPRAATAWSRVASAVK